VVGAIFAQFDLDSASNDLINADYIIGLPLTIRRHGFSIRARVYHQSSHLGDEYLLRSSQIQRENLSFESLELLASQEIGPLRVYGGGERIFRRDPDTVKPKLLHAGAELRSGRALCSRRSPGCFLLPGRLCPAPGRGLLQSHRRGQFAPRARGRRPQCCIERP